MAPSRKNKVKVNIKVEMEIKRRTLMHPLPFPENLTLPKGISRSEWDFYLELEEVPGGRMPKAIHFMRKGGSLEEKFGITMPIDEEVARENIVSTTGVRSSSSDSRGAGDPMSQATTDKFLEMCFKRLCQVVSAKVESEKEKKKLNTGEEGRKNIARPVGKNNKFKKGIPSVVEDEGNENDTIEGVGLDKRYPKLPFFQFVMDMDPEYLTGEDAGGPTKTEMDQFSKKFKMLTKGELEAALRVSPEDFVSVLNQMVPCVGCRRSAEAVFQQYQDGPNYGFYPLCVDEKGMMFLAKDKITPKFLCTMFHCPSLKVQNLIDSLSKCKSGRRCALHSLESQRIRTVSSWVDVWDYMDEKCQQRTVMVDSKCLIETLERYLKKHRFCTECKSKVLRAYNILTGELDPASEPGFIAQLYDGIECCKEDQHLHLMCKTEFVSRLIAKAVPELVGSSRRERHAKTMEIAQEEVLTCLGLCVFERLHRIQQRFREEERTWEIIMCTAIQALRRSFEVAVENKLGVSQLELLCQELNKEELAKQQRKERKKLNRKRKKEKKSEENAESVVEESVPDPDEINETLEESAEPFTEESNVTEAQELEDSCHCEPVETAPTKTRKKKKSGKGKNKTNASAELPLRQVSNGIVEKSETVAQKGSATSLCQELRCSSETSRDGGYSSESTSINHDNTTCSSLEGSEIACADDCCRLCPDFITSDPEPRIVQGPYRSLMEQLEDAGLSDNEEDSNWVPPEISAIQSASWGQEREQLRETLKLKFHEMLSKRKTGCFRRVGCTDQQHATGVCSDCCERDENRAPSKSANDENPQKDPDASGLKKSTRSGNGGSQKGNRGGQQNNRKYKGKNRR